MNNTFIPTLLMSSKFSLSFKSNAATFYLVILTILATGNQTSASNLPWLKTIDPDNKSNTIERILTKADVEVSDGTTYSVTTFFQGQQRVIFHREYPDRSVTQGIDGKYYWEFDGNIEKEGNNFTKNLVKGHQFIGMILLFEQFNNSLSKPEKSVFNGKNCMVVTGEQGDWRYKMYHLENHLPLGMELLIQGGPTITFLFSDWKLTHGINLPQKISIDDQSREFTYSFSSIEFDRGYMNDFRTPTEFQNDEQQLIKLHRMIMDGHLSESKDFFNPIVADSFTVVSSGEVFVNEGNAANEQMNKILSNRNYLVYDDLIRPMVKISDDGSLAWVIVQVYAKGIRYNEKLETIGSMEFTSAWIELYEKMDGKWKKMGNVSNFK